jgi:hypothetical protein
MNDQAIIESAYEDALRDLFATFYKVTIIAKDSAAKKAGADNFKNGVAIARAVRDEALKLIG